MKNVRVQYRGIKNVYGPAALRPDTYPDSLNIRKNTNLTTITVVMDGPNAVETFTLPAGIGLTDLENRGCKLVQIPKGTFRADYTTWPKEWTVKLS